MRSRRDVNSGVERVHVGAEVIDDDLTVVLVMINGERAVDQTKGLAAMADLRVSADNLHRIFAQQSLDGVIVGGGRSRITHNVENDGSDGIRSPRLGRLIVFQRNGLRGLIGSSKSMSASVCGHILICTNGDNTGVVAAAALNVADSEGTVQEGICNSGVARVGGGAVNLHRRIAQQSLDGAIVGGSGLGGSILFPHGVQSGGASYDNLAVGLVLCGRCVAVGTPAEEGIILTGWLLRGNGELVRHLILRGSLVGLAGGCAGTAVGVIIQSEGRENGSALEIIVSGVLAVDKQGAGSLAAPVAAASSPRDVVDLVVVNTIPDVFRIRKTEGVVVDVILAEVNGDVIATDAFDRIAAKRTADRNFDTRYGIVHRRVQHHGAVRPRRSFLHLSGAFHSFPLGNIGGIPGHGFGDFRLPAGEGIAFPLKSAAESGGRGTGRQVAVNLIGKYCAVCAVSVCNGERFRVFRRREFGLLLVHYDGLGFAIPRRILCQRSRGQKGADHDHCQKQTEKSAQTMFFHHEILSFHSSIRAAWHRPFNGNASITYLVEL